ncbi:MAG: hypothetical protein AB7J28_08865 [Hyphomonadaceae bacterium]
MAEEPQTVREFLDEREAKLIARLKEYRQLTDPLEAELADVQRAKGALVVAVPTGGEMTPDVVAALAEIAENEGLTLKQIALKALTEGFPDGATAAQLVEFIEKNYHRRIERSSLSPQLSRLKEHDKLLVQDGKLWKLAPKTTEPPAP